MMMMKNIFAFVLLGIMFISCSDDDNSIEYVSDCDLISQVIDEESFQEIETNNYLITNVELNQDCLEITFGSSGCDGSTWEENLFSKDVLFDALPLQRAVRFELSSQELCAAYFEKTVSFDLVPFQIEGQNEVPLNIEGWEEAIIYQY